MCSVLGSLPITIPARESCSVSIHVYLKGKPGVFTRKAAFLVIDDGFKKVEFAMTGQIVPAAGAGASSSVMD
jgi:hypothetical protein